MEYKRRSATFQVVFENGICKVITGAQAAGTKRWKVVNEALKERKEFKPTDK